MNIKELDDFLETNDIFNEFYTEIINLEVEELDDVLDITDVREHKAFKEAHEALEDILNTDDLHPLKNGDILIYEGEFTNTITKIDWGDFYKMSLDENKTNNDLDNALRIAPERKLGESGFVHSTDIKNVQIANIVKFLNQAYVVTEIKPNKSKDGFTFHARQLLKNGNVSKNKYIRVSSPQSNVPVGTISKSTYQREVKLPETVTKRLKELFPKEKRTTVKKNSNKPS